MNILHVTPYYAPAYAFGGVVRSVEGMARALARRGHHVTILTTDALDQQSRIPISPDENRDDVQVVRVANLSPRLRGSLNLSTPVGMKKIAETLIPGIDVVHCHEFRTVENLLVTPVAAGLNKPLLLSPHGTLALDTGRSHLKTAWDRLLSSAVALRFDGIIGLSQQEVDDAQALWPRFGRRRIPAEFCVIPNGVDPGDFEHLTGQTAFRERYQLGDALMCLYMGRLHPRKGVDVLVRAFKQANAPGARLVIAGPDEGLLATLQPMLDECISLTGYLDGQDRLAAFAAADMLALPAAGEGLPMVVLEAMAAGLPVIISPGCHLPEVAAHNAGLEVEPSVEPLAAALHDLLTDADKRMAMGQAARRLVQTRFTWDRVAEQLEAVYMRVCKSR
jgi:glycosyltransferase involved in cell wall biosynthesis